MKTTLMVLCLILTGCNQVEKTSPTPAHFQIVPSNNGGAWILDTTSGEVKQCAADPILPACYTAKQK